MFLTLTSSFQFEWNEEKASTNFKKHSIEFDMAARVFLDTLRLDFSDNREDYGEERRNTIGNIDGIIVHVTYTPREGRIRLISARKANSKERERYDGQDGQVHT